MIIVPVLLGSFQVRNMAQRNLTDIRNIKKSNKFLLLINEVAKLCLYFREQAKYGKMNNIDESE